MKQLLNDYLNIFIPSVVFVIAFFTFVACSSQVQEDFTPVPQPTVEYLWNHPVATPQFVTGVTTDAGRSGFEQDICVGIREGAIWEHGEFGSDVYNRIQKSTTVRLNGKVVGNLVFYQSTVSIDEFNSQKQVIGSHGGGVSICFNIPFVSQGTHLAMIEIPSKSGAKYLYTWAIKVP